LSYKYAEFALEQHARDDVDDGSGDYSRRPSRGLQPRDHDDDGGGGEQADAAAERDEAGEGGGTFDRHAAAATTQALSLGSPGDAQASSWPGTPRIASPAVAPSHGPRGAPPPGDGGGPSSVGVTPSFDLLDDAYAPLSAAVTADYHACVRVKQVCEHAADMMQTLAGDYNAEVIALKDLGVAQREMRFVADKRQRVAALLHGAHVQIERIINEQPPPIPE
jgi:hypothetical protein